MSLIDYAKSVDGISPFTKMEDEYVCVMFPYPSGSGLHLGHFYNYAIIDSYCNYLRYNGKYVFQPFGYDAFGLPAENYAKKVGRSPQEVTQENISNFKSQMELMQTSYQYLLTTTDEGYMALTSELFLRLYLKGLAYKKKSPVNYCNSCETTLANEQCKDGVCDRCGSAVETKNLEQWFFKITEYKDRLIKNLDTIDYPEKTKNAQRKWLENLNDWCVSRQRSWGCPIPIEGETDTLDTFVDSSFYYIVYPMMVGKAPKQVDLYVGGSEHACMHLIYARFICMFLYDEGVVTFEEPFKKVIHQGFIKNGGEKMSKSKGNTINPMTYPQDELRLYMMFIGHYFDGGEWDDSRMNGISKFLRRWNLWLDNEGDEHLDLSEFKEKIFKLTDAFKFNRVVSEFMILYNKNKGKKISRETSDELRGLMKIYTSNG